MTGFVSFGDLIATLGGDPTAVGWRLKRLGFLADGRPTLYAIVKGVAKKIPYDVREGRVGHAYVWSPDLLKPYLLGDDR
jgi:hypothetical protein